jgi:eukaryotic-like serine/threonine-protein kinase
MKPEHWQQLDKLFHSALEREPKERSAFLDKACAGDESLRKQVEALLAAHDEAGSFIESPAMEVEARGVAADQGSAGTAMGTGETVSHYRIISPLGSGGMGDVYLAQDTVLGRQVALKLLPADFTGDTHRVRRFEQEARAASALNHPNIITIYEIGQFDGRHFIATEFIDGQTLRQRISGSHSHTTGDGGRASGRHLKLSEILSVAIQTADALAAAHDAGIVHRDIKPENIMVRRRDSYVKVLDFGLAKLTQGAVDSEAPTRAQVRTSAGVVMGTPTYMSPEQARGEQVDARTDIWSLGVVLYELVAGCGPFERSTPSEVIALILEREPPPLARYDREVPPELERIVSKTLTKDKETRYQTAKDLLVDLRRLTQRLEVEAEIERTVPPELRGATDEARPSGGQEGVSTAQASAAQTATVESARTTSSVEYIITEIKRHKRGVAIALAAIILLSVAGIAYYFYSARGGSRAAIDSIAVLPLVNTSGDPNAEYLSDGISEALINSLTELRQWRVVARATAFRYKGREVDAQSVGRELNVRAVLMGKVRQMGDTLNIQVDLVDATTGAQLWGQEYERKVSDVLSIKQAIAREVTEKLRLRLSGGEERQLTTRDTTNAEAYRFYLRGRFFWNKRTTEGIKKAIEEFQQAIDRDPNYALGYVGLADSFLLLDEYGGIPESETLPKARAAADRALQIDDSLAEGHTSSALIYQRLWRWGEEEAEFKRAISLNPNYATAHHWFAIYFALKQQFDDALIEIKRAQTLDPLSPVINTTVAEVYLLKNDPDSAIEECKRVIELDPHFPGAHDDLGNAYLKQRRYQEAMTELQKAVELSGGGEGLSDLGYLYAVTGRRSQALRILKELEEKYARHEAIGMSLAGVYAGLGEKNQAFAWLERDFEQHSGVLPFITYSSMPDLRSDPRYADLVRRMGLTP